MNITKKIHVLLYLCLAIAGKAYGASPPNCDEKSASKLIKAIFSDDIAKADALLNRKIDVNATDNNGTTALMLAAAKGYTDIVNKCLRKRANVNATDNYGATALMDAVSFHHFEIIKKLLTCKADINAISNAGTTALTLAVDMNNYSIVELLLKHRADVNTANENSQTALTLAIHEGDTHMIGLLKAAAQEQAAKNTAKLAPEKQAAQNTAKLAAEKQAAKNTARLAAEKQATEKQATQNTARLAADKAMAELVAQEEEEAKKTKERPAAAAKKLVTKASEAINAEQAFKIEQLPKLAVQKEKQTATKKPTTSKVTQKAIIETAQKEKLAAEIVRPATEPTEKVDVEKTEAQKQRDEQKRLERAEKQAARAIADQERIAAEQAIAEQKKIEAETATLVEQEAKREKKQLKRAAKKSAAEQQQAIAAGQNAADELSRPQWAGKQAATRADKECPICLDDIEGDNGAQLTCGHETCRDCAQKIIEAALVEGNGNARCSIAECRMLLGQNDIKTICGDNIALQTRYDILLNESFIFKKAGRTVDPSQEEEDIRTITCHECKGIFSIIPQEEFQQKTKLCGNKLCRARFCGRCYLPYHKGLSCAHAAKQAEAHKAEEGAAPVLESNEIKLCPTCDFSVIKEGEGCNFVICSRCPEWEWCWYCKKRFKIKIDEQTKLKLPRQGHKEHLCADGQLIHTAYGLTLQEARERIKAKQMGGRTPRDTA